MTQETKNQLTKNDRDVLQVSDDECNLIAKYGTTFTPTGEMEKLLTKIYKDNKLPTKQDRKYYRRFQEIRLSNKELFRKMRKEAKDTNKILQRVLYHTSLVLRPLDCSIRALYQTKPNAENKQDLEVKHKQEQAIKCINLAYQTKPKMETLFDNKLTEIIKAKNEKTKFFNNALWQKNKRKTFSPDTEYVPLQDMEILNIEIKKLVAQGMITEIPLNQPKGIHKDTTEARKFMTRIDIKSAFHHVPLTPTSRAFFAFDFCHTRYAFMALPFGLTTSSQIFTKILKPVIEDARILWLYNQQEKVATGTESKKYLEKMQKGKCHERDLGTQISCPSGKTECNYGDNFSSKTILKKKQATTGPLDKEPRELKQKKTGMGCSLKGSNSFWVLGEPSPSGLYKHVETQSCKECTEEMEPYSESDNINLDREDLNNMSIQTSEINSEHIPGHLNVQADQASRMKTDQHNWMITREIFNQI
ncbi:29022_t:CDS:10 [Gigaspora margarita]|uniref:29022_t:CDS:1 n=1 Tax=Gigaspora margarita TaxID=4874 RepID=A0ABN7V6N6_GIGMA|nr:29022_t:CDS:10 [Gigaspora margarita]